MPLMQLSTLVLPAPFGPMRANSSPAATANDTLSRTVRPPKRSVRPAIANSAIPSPAAAIRLDVAVAPAFAGGLAEIELLDIAVLAQPLGRAVEHDAAVFHDIGIVGDLKRERRALLDEQDGQPKLAPDVDQSAQQVLHHHRREAERQLVHQQQFGPADEGAGNGEHLPLATRQQATDAGLEIGEPGKELEHQSFIPPPLGEAHAGGRRAEIFRHREVGKHLVALGDQDDAAPADLVRHPVFDPLALERDAAVGDARIVDAEEAGYRAQRRGLAGPIGAEQGDDLAALGGEQRRGHETPLQSFPRKREPMTTAVAIDTAAVIMLGWTAPDGIAVPE